MESNWNSVFGPEPRRRQSPKVVSVPVRFVSSDRRRSDAAVRIQKAVRGLLGRRSVRRIAAARREVEEVAAAISPGKIRRDERERVRLNESLMRTLLELDSIRGVNSEVRELRKKVIKTAVALQERIDEIAAAIDESEPDSTVSDEAPEDKMPPEKEEKESGAPVISTEERLVEMVAELCEWSAEQSRVLRSLSERVEQLERAHLCDKLRRKKKQRRASSCDHHKTRRF